MGSLHRAFRSVKNWLFGAQPAVDKTYPNSTTNQGLRAPRWAGFQGRLPTPGKRNRLKAKRRNK